MKRIDLISGRLLEQYVQICLMIERARKSMMLSEYSTLDMKRIEIHNKILEELGADREDNDLNFELSLYLECFTTKLA